MISIFGSTEMRWIESLIAAAVMTVFCVVLFVYLLNLPFQLWPQPNAPTLLVQQLAEFFRLDLRAAHEVRRRRVALDLG